MSRDLSTRVTVTVGLGHGFEVRTPYRWAVGVRLTRVRDLRSHEGQDATLSC